MGRLLLTVFCIISLPLAAPACDPAVSHCSNTTVTNPDGTTTATTYAYDSAGVSVGSGITVTAVSSDGSRTAATTYYDPKGRNIGAAITRYDSHGRLASTTSTRPDSSSFTINYDSGGNMISTVTVSAANDIAVAYFDPRYNSATASYDDSGYYTRATMTAAAPEKTGLTGQSEMAAASGSGMADSGKKGLIDKTTGGASLAFTALGVGALAGRKSRRVSFAVVTGVALALL